MHDTKPGYVSFNVNLSLFNVNSDSSKFLIKLKKSWSHCI